MAQRSWGLVAAALFVCAPAWASTVAVAPISGGKHGEADYVRHQIESGLSDGGLTVVGAAALANAAKKAGLSPSDLNRPPVLMPSAKAAGADAVLTAVIESKGKNDELNIRVFNLDGVELWSRPIKMVKGKLSGDIPKKIAKAVTAAMASAPGASNAAGGDVTSSDSGQTEGGDATAAATDGSSGSSDGSTDAAAETPPSKPNKPAKAQPASDEGETAIVSPKRKPAKVASAETGSEGTTSGSTGEGEVAIEGPPKEAKADTTPQPPIIDVNIGFALLSRTYKLCPGVTSCSQTGPAPSVGADGTQLDTPLSYQTSSPSGGIILRAELFPLPKLVPINETMTFTAGATVEYLRSFSVTNGYQDPITGAQAKFGSSMSRLTADATGRLYFRMLNGTGFAGLYAGLLMPSFNVDTNPLLAPSTRTGFDLGFKGELPLASNFVKLSLAAAFAPAANPGVDETTDYGSTGKGKGFLVRGGFAGNYEFISYGAYVDFASFSDVFDGAGLLTTNGAVSEERYMTYFFMVGGRY
ncbi:MAG: hypothetical protein JST54_29760 [Deltaproteobacteria bacterium]|nr:hypothetical protein [Deltaproteobacteria bacterium]